MGSFLKVSRRRFLASTAAVTGSLLLQPSFAAFAADAKTLRIAAREADGSAATMDPAFNTSDPDSARISLAYERLVVLDESFTPAPQLAESWSSNDTADTWTFKLKPGVKFQDGTPLSARDVIYTYRRLVDPAVGSPAAASMSVVDPDGISASDDLTVTFRLKGPVVEFPGLIANRFTYIVKDGALAEDLRTKGIGSGPFKVERFVPGEEPSVFVKSEHYWREGYPKVDVVELRSIPDTAAHMSALQSGQIDLSWDVPRIGLAALEGNADVAVQSVPSPFVMSFSMLVDTPPFDDVRVRTAMKLVVDRQQMIDIALSGRGRVGYDTPVAPWVQYGLPETDRPRDIAKAKQLLAEAGHPDGIDVELYTSEATEGFIDMATLYQAMASEAGIRVKINKTPADDYFANIWRKVPFCCSSKSGRNADEAMATFYLSDAKWNDTHWQNKEFDGYIAEARRTVDRARRTEIYQAAQRLLQEDGGAIVPMFSDAVGATRANVSGWKVHPQKFSKDFSTVTIG